MKQGEGATLPDYRDVPTSLADAKIRRDFGDVESYRLWETYGNDHDGPQGEFIWPTVIDGRPVGQNVPLSQAQFEWWWNRNKWHNWCFITMRKPVVNPRYVCGRPSGDDLRAELNNFAVLRFNPFFLKIGPLYSGWRSDKPTWPVDENSRWHELGSGGGALDLIGAKWLSWVEPTLPQGSG